MMLKLILFKIIYSVTGRFTSENEHCSAALAFVKYEKVENNVLIIISMTLLGLEIFLQ